MRLFLAKPGLPLVAAVCLALLGVVWDAFAPPLLLPIDVAQGARERVAVGLMVAAAIVSVAVFLARTVDRRAAAYAVAILALTPLWFVPSRATALAVVPVAALAIATSGIGLALFDEQASRHGRAIAIVAALLACVLAGLRAPGLRREIVLAVSIAATSTSAARLLFRARESRLVPLIVFAVGTIGLGLSARSLGLSKTTFDVTVARAAYGLAPWSALVPFAIARRPRTPAHLALILAAVLSLGASTLFASSGSMLLGTAVLAATVGVMLRDLDLEDRPKTALAACVFAVGALVAHDVALAPDRLVGAFAAETKLAEGHATAAAQAFRIAAWIVLVAAVVALLLSRDLLTIGKVRLQRGLLVAGGGVVAGLVLRLHAYPDLAERLSPGPAFHAWMAQRHAGEPLGLVGVDRRALSAIPSQDLVTLPETASAVRYLENGAGSRRYVALGQSELPRINAEWRAHHSVNVPVIAGRGAVLLAVSTLNAGEPSQNPLDAVVLSSAPRDLRTVEAKLSDAVEILGWRHEPNHVKVVFRVLRPAALAGHCTFLHVDHSPTRFGAEHREHAYPQSLWREGDIIVDDFEVKLPPHFRTGSYAAWFGAGVLPCQDDRRMSVTAGPHDAHDRVALGQLEVK